MKRREFVSLLGTAAAGSLLPAASQNQPGDNSPFVIEAGPGRIQVSVTGEILSFQSHGQEFVDRRWPGNQPTVLHLGKRFDVCRQPTTVRPSGDKVVFHYELPEPYPVSVAYEIGLTDLQSDGVALVQRLSLKAPRKLGQNLAVRLPRNIRLPQDTRRVFLPLKNGVGRQQEIRGLDNDDEYVYRLCGGYIGGKPQSLAIPMVSETADGTDMRLTLCTDPYTTSYFRLPYGENPGQFQCLFLDQVGLTGGEERAVYTVAHKGGSPAAMKAFYRTALPDVRPGPDWTHDIALVNYDYLSDNGQGWFADIDKLTELIKPADRGKVLLALHGWYDYVGKYSYNLRTRSLEQKWIAFSNVQDHVLQALGNAPDLYEDEVYRFFKKNLARTRPVDMSLAEVHRRIKYAKDRGFRVIMYYSDSLAACSGVTEIYDPKKVLTWGGWIGPDTKGKTYRQNPLCPEVREYYKNYMQAMLNEFGKEVDGFNWDETFFISSGDLGTDDYPGYADRAFMTLIKEVAAILATYSPHLALFTSDSVGWKVFPHDFTNNAPYGLMGHGTYQDSWCRPEGWPGGLFPNYRNTLWSCCWAPVAHFPYVEYGAKTFDTPVSISNGCFGEDLGVSEMPPEHVNKVMDLFADRKKRRMQISWIEEAGGQYTYQGRPIKYQNSIW